MDKNKKLVCDDCHWCENFGGMKLCRLPESPFHHCEVEGCRPCYEFVPKTDGEKLHEAWEELKETFLKKIFGPVLNWLERLCK